MDQAARVRKIMQNYIAKKSNFANLVMPVFFLMMASISVITTLGILWTLVFDAYKFFAKVGLVEVFGTKLAPLAANPSFGILPLINGTLLTTAIAMCVAIPFGLSAAVYLSQFATDRARKLLKPIIETLAGIPTIVYGFFAYTFVTPLLMNLIPSLEAKNVLSPGIVMGIMIIPMVASLSEDAMNAVPEIMREGALALSSTKLETAWYVVIPSSISGIIASIVLAISRAIGETMIVTIGSGSTKNIGFDITKSMQTMTGYIVEFISGDAASGTTGYYSLYAVGLLLFVFTLTINYIAQRIARRYQEVV